MPHDLQTAPQRRGGLGFALVALMIGSSAGHPGLASAKPAAKAGGPAEDLAKEATRRYKEGEFELAAQLFMKAYALDKRPDRVFNAARGYEKAGKAEQAIALFRLYGQITDDEAGRQEAQLRVAALESGLKAKAAPPPSPREAAPLPAPATNTAELPAPAEKTPPTVRAPAPMPPPAAGPQWPAWTAFGVAVLAAGGAGAMYYWVRGDEANLQESLEVRTDAGYVTGIDQEHAVERHALQGTVRTWAAISAGAAMAGIAAGLWLWPRRSAVLAEGQVAVQAGPGAVAIRVRF